MFFDHKYNLSIILLHQSIVTIQNSLCHWELMLIVNLWLSFGCNLNLVSNLNHQSEQKVLSQTNVFIRNFKHSTVEFYLNFNYSRCCFGYCINKNIEFNKKIAQKGKIIIFIIQHHNSDVPTKQCLKIQILKVQTLLKIQTS